MFVIYISYHIEAFVKTKFGCTLSTMKVFSFHNCLNLCHLISREQTQTKNTCLSTRSRVYLFGCSYWGSFRYQILCFCFSLEVGIAIEYKLNLVKMRNFISILFNFFWFFCISYVHGNFPTKLHLQLAYSKVIN